MSNDEPELFLWINPQDMLKISRKLGLHLHRCFGTLMMHTAEANGVINYEGRADTGRRSADGRHESQGRD